MKLNGLKKIIFWISIIFIIVALFSLTIGQYLLIDFKNYKIHNYFYQYVFTGLPFAFLLTLCGTLRKQNSKLINRVIVTFTVFLSGFSFFILIFTMFTTGFGCWINESIIYRKIDNNDITINDQIYDIGALGYAGKRTVKLKPIFISLQTVEIIDTTKIDKTEWTYVSEEGDIYFP
jgi:hypothetical protein